MTTAVPLDQSITARPAGKREWWGLAVLMLPTILLAVDMTVLHLAVPSLSADLAPTSTQLLWILDIYGFMIAGFLITMGTLGDRIGRRRLLLIGALAFGIASVIAAFATTAEMLIAARALLGVAGATLMPSTLSLIRNMFLVEQERTFAITVWMTGFIVGSAAGPLVGGLMLEFFWWGSVFLLGVPVMALLLITGPVLLPEFRDEASGRLDLTSAVLSIVSLLTIIYGVKHIARDGIAVASVLTIVAGLAVGAVFIRRQRRLADPMFDLTLFKRRAFSVSIVAMLLTILALSGTWLVVFQYLQGVLELSPLMAGVAMLPATGVQVVASLLVPALSRRVSRSVLIASGLLVAALGFAAMTQAAGSGSLILLLVAVVLMSTGVMPMMVLGVDLVVSSAPVEKAGAASATSETAAELGMALGIAVFGSIAAAVYRKQMIDTASSSLPPELVAIAQDTLGGALAAVKELPAVAGAELLAAAQAAFSAALYTNAMIGAVIAVGVAVLTACCLRQVSVSAPPAADDALDTRPSV
ncbi:MFS transporter [Alkalilimnicola ehrlichii]|uniref:MFS transporter n=1 Tax=Alkalilimnicola ehrlichii TaxID=351052 RepID=A0A3E0WTQ4_9GAMM|nr:MFS transporter [Alkalilimnicola ehrlichii]RFA27183.1 MFS transporter [Alkalilimnicola ehrlichii]RFA35356.1 MFS transporter [Alkalilimnicola ehrlichii]